MKKYFALAIDIDGDLVANSVAESSVEEAEAEINNSWESPRILQIIEVELPEPAPKAAAPVLKLKLKP